MNAALERQVIGLELVIDHDDVDLHRRWRRCSARQRRACEDNGKRKHATACATVTRHEHPFLSHGCWTSYRPDPDKRPNTVPQ